MLAVVDNQQQLLDGQEALDRVRRGLALERDDRQCAHDRPRHVLRAPDSREPQEPGAVREVGLNRARGLQRQPRLAHAARPGQGQQAHRP